MKNSFHKKGFTLIELLVVIVILGILSTISVGTFRSYFAKARDSERVSAVQNVAMMIKVGSGGDGGCGVYNFTLDGGNLTSSSSTACTDMGVMEDLILENDYKMPEPKSGLKYYYGYQVGPREGDNEFFIASGVEEDKPQNGTEIQTSTAGTGSGNYIFIDGTRGGIEALVGTDGNAPACAWDLTDQAPDACTGWIIHPFNADGSLDTAVN